MTKKHEHATLRIWQETRVLLRLLSAYEGESMVRVLHGLVKAALEKRERKGK